jgi:hypothetical protein
MSFSLTSPSLLPVWEILDVVGLAVVWIGAYGEYKADQLKTPFNPSNFSEFESHKKKWVKRWGVVLIVGLALETMTSIFVMAASNKEIAQLDSARVELEHKVEELRKENLELEAIVQPRTITDTQKGIFILSLMPLRSSPSFKDKVVAVEVQQSDFEAFVYAKQITNLLIQAGVPVELDAGLSLFSDGPVSGLRFLLRDSSPLPPEAEAICSAFSKAGIVSKICDTSLTTNMHQKNAIFVIVVGSKPIK